jgi:hypothetical protein
MTVVGPDGRPVAKVPKHLEEGFKAFTEWEQARARAGIPLPPGMYFCLNKGTVLKDALSRCRVGIAQRLSMPLSCVIFDLDWDDAGRLLPKIDVDPPDEWLAKWTGKHDGGTRVEEFAKEHIMGVVRDAYRVLQHDIVERVGGLLYDRPDLLPKCVEDLLGDATKEPSVSEVEAPGVE